MIWSIASSAKLTVMISTIGRSPAIAAPTPIPTIVFSEIGVSRTRFSPNSSSRPSRDLEGALEDAHVLAHQEHRLVVPHLLAHRLVQRLAVAHHRHQPRSFWAASAGAFLVLLARRRFCTSPAPAYAAPASASSCATPSCRSRARPPRGAPRACARPPSTSPGPGRRARTRCRRATRARARGSRRRTAPPRSTISTRLAGRAPRTPARQDGPRLSSTFA